MPLSRPARTRSASIAVALPVWLRWVGHKYALPLLFVVATVCVGVGHGREAELAALRARVTQGMLPLWQALAAPGQAASDLSHSLSGWRDTYAENSRLRADNTALLQWRDAAQRLAVENQRLAVLSNFASPPQAKALTARVIADIDGPYQTALLVLAGARDGIAPGAVVLGPQGGVIGRVTELGETSARVLLLTDPGARIPARLEQSGAAAIAAGDGQNREARIGLLYLPHDATPVAGERVVTSGHGGIFPAGLPIGTIELDRDGTARVVPLEPDLANGSTPEIVRIVDYQVAIPVAK